MAWGYSRVGWRGFLRTRPGLRHPGGVNVPIVLNGLRAAQAVQGDGLKRGKPDPREAIQVVGNRPHDQEQDYRNPNRPNRLEGKTLGIRLHESPQSAGFPRITPEARDDDQEC